MGGNITSTFSDHFAQFCILDCFEPQNSKTEPKFKRSFKNFSNDEFRNKLNSLNWGEKFGNTTGSECLSILYNNVHNLLDEMAPVKKLTKKRGQLGKVSLDYQWAP